MVRHSTGDIIVVVGLEGLQLGKVTSYGNFGNTYVYGFQPFDGSALMWVEHSFTRPATDLEILLYV